MFLNVETHHLVKWVILTRFVRNVIYFQIQGLYDVKITLMENMEGLITLVFFKIESTNLASWGILMQFFQNVIYFQSQSFYDVSITS